MSTQINYLETEEELQNLQCPECSGLGECIESERGDISFNEWDCPECNGTGFKDGQLYRICKYELPEV